jgi:hypothetical protein
MRDFKRLALQFNVLRTIIEAELNLFSAETHRKHTETRSRRGSLRNYHNNQRFFISSRRLIAEVEHEAPE